ncbi:hypothetical protein BVRB_026380, partial [Beta vulgaris subsp. vulgaris]
DEEIDGLKSSCIDKIRPLLGGPIADVEGAIHEQTSEWMANRMMRQKSREEEHRQLLLKLVARTLLAAQNQPDTELLIHSRMFGRLLSAFLNSSLQESLFSTDIVQAGEFLGMSSYRPSNLG